MNAIGGGVLPDDAHVLVAGSGPYNVAAAAYGGPATAWAAWVSDTDTSAAHSFVVFAVCITAGQAH
jgi:hypothetical protein